MIRSIVRIVRLVRKDIKKEGLFDRVMGGLLVSLMIITAISFFIVIAGALIAFIGFCFGNPITGASVIGMIIVAVLILITIGMAANAKFEII